jgi:phytoene dehydrogenase-like protein
MMLTAIERVIPGVSQHLVLAEVGTPLTNAFYCESRRGGCYGIEKSPFQVGPFAFSTRSAVPGLFLCGASTLSHGVAGSAISGLHAARDALGIPDAAELLDAPDGSLQLVPNGAPEPLAPAYRAPAIDASEVSSPGRS